MMRTSTKSSGTVRSLQGRHRRVVGVEADLRDLAAAVVVLAVAEAVVVAAEAASATASRTRESVSSGTAAISATILGDRPLSSRNGQGQAAGEGEGEGEENLRAAAVVVVAGTAAVEVAPAEDEAEVGGFVDSTTHPKDASSARAAACATSKDLLPEGKPAAPDPWEIRSPWCGDGRKFWFRGVIADLYFLLLRLCLDWRIPEDSFNVLFVGTDGPSKLRRSGREYSDIIKRSWKWRKKKPKKRSLKKFDLVPPLTPRVWGINILIPALLLLSALDAFFWGCELVGRIPCYM